MLISTLSGQLLTSPLKVTILWILWKFISPPILRRAPCIISWGKKMGIHYLPLAFCSNQHYTIQLRWVATPVSRTLELVLSRWLVLISVLQKNRKKKKQRETDRERQREIGRESCLFPPFCSIQDDAHPH